MPNIVRTHQILVQVPLQKAFDYVSDLTLHPEWSGGELKIEAVGPGPVAIGKQYRSRGEVGVQKDRPNTVRISAYEPPREFGFVARDPGFGDVSHVFTFKEQGEGTLIERTMTLSLHPIVALLFGFLIYPFVGRPSMDKSLARLKQNLETR
jgi:uncharacterized protein YndB with AHSA1/START domain